ncbi:MAG: cell division protein FtsQ/DivIB [Acidobacteriota bacterium]
MKRKAYDESDFLPGMEGPPGASSKTAAATKSRNAKSRLPRLTKLRLIVASIVLVFATTTSVYAFHVAEDFLIRDSRFAVPILAGTSEPAILIAGAAHASLESIENVFASDIGRSLYLVPMKDRLTSVRAVAWVQDASIARIWPNRLMINVVERKPVAFVTLPSSRFALIDAEGIILPPAPDDFNLPVLRGIKPSEPAEVRKAAVQRMLRLSAELGAAIKDISEIDVSKADNLAVSRPYQGRILKLMLGDRNLAARYNNFVTHFSEIESRVPAAAVLDLRLEDRITVMESAAE